MNTTVTRTCADNSVTYFSSSTFHNRDLHDCSRHSDGCNYWLHCHTIHGFKETL